MAKCNLFPLRFAGDASGGDAKFIGETLKLPCGLKQMKHICHDQPKVGLTGIEFQCLRNEAPGQI